MHVLCLSFFHCFLIGSLNDHAMVQLYSDGKKKKVKTTCQIAIELTSTVHILENQALTGHARLSTRLFYLSKQKVKSGLLATLYFAHASTSHPSLKPPTLI